MSTNQMLIFLNNLNPASDTEMGNSGGAGLVVVCCVLWWSSVVRARFDPQILDRFLHDQALLLNNASDRRTGSLYDVVLPVNFSGMAASVVRFRSGSFRKRGANISFFHFPPNILTAPYVMRFDLVLQNLGNWSSSYYNVSNHTLVAPVVGFLGYGADHYDDATPISYRMVDFSLMEDPILVHFPKLDGNNKNNSMMKCVRFGINGSVEYSNVTLGRFCVARGQGHFSLVIPTPTPPEEKKPKGSPAVWKWWAVGCGVGLIIVGILMYKCVKKKKREGRMEKESERNEALDGVWVGRSRMPYASAIRTQPVLEENYVP